MGATNNPEATEQRAGCPHPPRRNFAWFAYDGTLCVGCSECGEVLKGEGGA